MSRLHTRSYHWKFEFPLPGFFICCRFIFHSKLIGNYNLMTMHSDRLMVVVMHHHWICVIGFGAESWAHRPWTHNHGRKVVRFGLLPELPAVVIIFVSSVHQVGLNVSGSIHSGVQFNVPEKALAPLFILNWNLDILSLVRLFRMWRSVKKRSDLVLQLLWRQRCSRLSLCGH